MTCEDVSLEVLADRKFHVTGKVMYHSISSIEGDAPQLDPNTQLEVELLRNPSFNYRGTDQPMKMIHVALVSQHYIDSIIARGGDEMSSHYEKFCQIIEEGRYTLHLFSSGAIGIDELGK